MSQSLQHLFDNNRAWAQSMVQQDPAYFSRLANQQTPKYLWIGCSDSRVPAEVLTGSRARYEADLEAAKQAIRHGESKPPAGLAPAELAAWTLVANLMLNLDETLSRN